MKREEDSECESIISVYMCVHMCKHPKLCAGMPTTVYINTHTHMYVCTCMHLYLCLVLKKHGFRSTHVYFT